MFITTVGALAQDARALCSQGKRLKEAGKLEEAAAAYREAARVDPTLAEAHWGLGWVYIQLGLRSQAATEFVAVLDLTRDTALKQECQRTLERMGIKPPSPPLPSEEALSTVAG
ncbi:MAG: tetratricopeptide repeat protein, partial [Candidatus Zipacnadales bacterium]